MASVDLKEKGVALLSTTTISFATADDGDTVLYRVPTGKRCILSHADIVAAADASTTTITIGQSGDTIDFLAENTLSGLAAQYDSVTVRPIPALTPLKSKSYAAGTVIKATIVGAGSAGNTLYLLGRLY